MYSKKPVAKYQYNDPEPAELAQVLSPEHTALIIIDMQNDFASDKGKFALGGRDSTAVKSIIPACQRLLMAGSVMPESLWYIFQQTTLPDRGRATNGGWPGSLRPATENRRLMAK